MTPRSTSFIESLKQLGHHIPHILVQNPYLYDEEQWAAIANSLAPQLSEYGVRSIYIPKLLKYAFLSVYRF